MDYTTKLIVIARKIRDELHTLADRLYILSLRIQEQTKAIGQSTHAAQKEREIPPKVITETHLPTGVETHKSATDAASENKYQRWALFIQVLTLFAVVWYACVAHRQWKAMLESNETNRQALVSVQRAFLTCRAIVERRDIVSDKSGAHGVWSFTMPCENSGTTPANVTAQAFFTDVLETEPTEAEFLRKPLIQKAVIGPKDSRNVGYFRTKELDFFGYEMPVKTSDLLAMLIQTANITKPHVFWGWVSYHDVFPVTNLHITESCQVLSGMSLDRTNPEKPFAFGYIPCDHHNCADEHCEDYESVKKLAGE